MKISICIPVYQVERFIERCARSLFAQTVRSDIEFIFVDDCSMDGSMDIVKRVLADYPERQGQVVFLRHDKNRGLAVARQTAMHAASGDWIGHCDSDDWVDADYYEKMLAVGEKCNADMVYTSVLREFENGISVKVEVPAYDVGHEFVMNACPGDGFNAMCNKIYHRERALDKGIEIYDRVSLGEDLMYSAQAVAKCGRIAYCKDVLYHYRQNVTSITNKRRGAKRVADLCAVYNLLQRKLTDRKFQGAKDRLCRDILLAAIRFSAMSSAEFAAWRSRLASALLSDRRHGIGKKGILAIASLSYPLACLLTRMIRRSGL